MNAVTPSPNFAHLQQHDEQLLRLGMLAERYFPDDPNTALLKLRQFAELLAQLAASNAGVFNSPEEPQFELIRRLQDGGIAPKEVAQVFTEVRRSGNAASHALIGGHREALAALKLCWQLGLWYHRTFAEPRFKSGPFVPPASPRDESAELREELTELRESLARYRDEHRIALAQLEFTEAKLRTATDEQTFWATLAEEADQAKVTLERRLVEIQASASSETKERAAARLDRSRRAAELLQLDESDTRKLIDEQLRDAGWDADTVSIAWGKGARPAKGRNVAIAECPTDSGPADYVLFVGLTPIATVEAKRKNIDVSASLQQAKRYSRGFRATDDCLSPGGPWDDFRIPFTFSSNGRPYLKQLSTRSGVWFCDVRRATNLGRPLDDWYTPEGLRALLARDEEASEKKLEADPFEYGFPLREYQRKAILAAEEAIAKGQRELLLAMATGTGKTKTCIALIYRLLKAQRFRRVLFLVDREPLGDQAANAFKDTRMENLQTFADTFGIKELEDQLPDSDTCVHIATVQGMVQRVLYARDGQAPVPVDQYDCIIVDECHRGYLLDRELSDTELQFRGFEDYVSKYRRVIEHFDAVKIGLTATPALHTTEIFGPPVFTYSYREAVIDGFLVDHEPPIQIRTDLSTSGIMWQMGEEVKAYDPVANQLALFTAPDEIKIEVEAFNRKVITEAFNRVVCEYLATEIDPGGEAKTLIFCVNDAHADLVVDLLKKAFEQRYGMIDDDAVMKITGAADKPLQLIRRYKNERLPNAAVTVDLLTTGIDVPRISNLVFLRRVNSRILFDQMLGRATRLCDEIGKASFRIFDAVQMYEALKGLSAMQPVVSNPDVTFQQLIEEMTTFVSDHERADVLDQFVAKLQRKKARLTGDSLADFEAVAGMSPNAFLDMIRHLAPEAVAAWFVANPGLGEILERTSPSGSQRVLVSDHPDQFAGVSRGYGGADKPEDYLDDFVKYIKEHINEIPALVTVTTRPRELTRKQLRELRIALDSAGFSESHVMTAYRDLTSKDIAAGIVGYVRQAALGDPLVPYDQRVDRALERILSSQAWTTPQRDWLRRIAAQTKANTVVDTEALKDPTLVVWQQGGGFERLDKMFDGHLQAVIENFNDYIWEPVA